VVSVTLVGNHVPIHAEMISAHDPESQSVFDLLMGNPTAIQPTIHSTDTHGTNQINFALQVFGARWIKPLVGEYINAPFV
jgi:hypothetical protein